MSVHVTFDTAQHRAALRLGVQSITEMNKHLDRPILLFSYPNYKDMKSMVRFIKDTSAKYLEFSEGLSHPDSLSIISSNESVAVWNGYGASLDILEQIKKMDKTIGGIRNRIGRSKRTNIRYVVLYVRLLIRDATKIVELRKWTEY